MYVVLEKRITENNNKRESEMRLCDDVEGKHGKKLYYLGTEIGKCELGNVMPRVTER